ncbi:MAG TPA: M48 family metalloprotease [Thermoanaerobaculia bacterium]|nr:M48 family metalloprotease [Thermoanaerobaculia bacterium]
MLPTIRPRRHAGARPAAKARRLALAFTLLSAFAAGCATNPVTGKPQLALMTVEQEIAMGRQAHQEVLQAMGAYEDPELQRYVEGIGARLAGASERPDLPWTFTVIDDPSVNAFALPGGFIYLTRGILSYMASEAEMVSVLGHEIGHVTARHSVERISKAQLAQVGMIAGMILAPELRGYGDLASTGLQVMFLKFSRDDERQADDLGFRYMNQAGYEPREMVEMFRVLDRVSRGAAQGRLPAWLATHPNPEGRLGRIEQQIQALSPEMLGSTVDRGEFLAAIDGVVFGEDPREGYFRGSTFYHPELGFSLRFPEGWRTSNQKQAVGAISPREDAIVVLSVAQGGSPDEAARQFFGQQGIRRGNAWRSDLGGLPAVSGSFAVSRAQGGDIVGLAAFVEHGGQVFQLLGYTVQSKSRAYQSTLEGSLATFDRLTDRRYLNVQPKRIDLVTIDRAMTLAEFERRYPSTVDLETLAIINHVQPGDTLRAGQPYKRVVGGELP